MYIKLILNELAHGSRGKFKGVLERLAQALGLCMVIAHNSFARTGHVLPNGNNSVVCKHWKKRNLH
jgi:hypothetical protein